MSILTTTLAPDPIQVAETHDPVALLRAHREAGEVIAAIPLDDVRWRDVGGLVAEVIAEARSVLPPGEGPDRGAAPQRPLANPVVLTRELGVVQRRLLGAFRVPDAPSAGRDSELLASAVRVDRLAAAIAVA